MDKMMVKFPSKLKSDLEKHQNDPKAIQQIGIEQAVEQCCGLIAAGVGEIHFFVLNQSEPIKTILKELRI
jgi:methylenetetrahydrofolate reductase (NADPH)